MKWISSVLVVLPLLSCSPLVPVYAPRRDNTEFHREATAREDCLGCHEVGKIRNHGPESNCLGCHKLNEVY